MIPVPVIVGALRTIKGFENRLVKIGNQMDNRDHTEHCIVEIG